MEKAVKIHEYGDLIMQDYYLKVGPWIVYNKLFPLWSSSDQKEKYLKSKQATKEK